MVRARFVCALFTRFVCTAGGNQVRLREARVTRGARGYGTRCVPCLGCAPLELRSYSTGQRCAHRLPIMLVPRACGYIVCAGAVLRTLAVAWVTRLWVVSIHGRRSYPRSRFVRWALARFRRRADTAFSHRYLPPLVFPPDSHDEHSQ